jgi:N-acetylmuramoyl-L-alanine amidase
MRDIDLIVIHCSATKEGQDVTIEEIAKWHRARGFKRIGYHYVVKLDGTVEIGRGLHEVGAHAQGHNASSIGICYVGGLDKNGKPKDTRTTPQRQALRDLVQGLVCRWPDARVCGHRDLSPDLNGNGKVDPHEWLKACPCFDVASDL